MNVNKFYHFDKNDFFDPSIAVSKNVDRVASFCLNDNQMARIVFTLNENCRVLSDLDVALSPDTPEEVKNFINMIQTQHTPIAQAPDDDSAFDFIRSRYMEAPCEVEQFAQSLADEINSYSTPSQPSQPSPAPSADVSA